jgi:deoxycytidylate deaminase
MLPDTNQLLRDPSSELVFGLVAPVGADLDGLESALSDQLRQYGYTPNSIRLSKLLKGLGVDLKEEPEFDRLTSYMDGGNLVRERSESGEILALWAMASIKGGRTEETPVRRRTAHILRSIKHPDEVRALRAVYGPGFFLVGLSASTKQKTWQLKQKGLTQKEAEDLIRRDAGEPNSFGQQTRDAFDLADVYVRQDRDRTKTTEQLERFLRLVFGAVVETPTRDEHAMLLAYASSLRSADLSRQVGAVVWKDNVGVVATGCNDVPAAGGGLYWGGSEDQRDHVRGEDANEQHRNEIADEVARKVQEALGLGEHSLEKIRKACKSTRLLDITEFGRAAHAEMDALLACARAGTETIGATLFSTTFPCHNCAKHIVAAGIRRVVYIEPYEKSKALELHGDSIRVDDHGDDEPTGAQDRDKKVVFEPFVGVGPRRYFDLFSMKLSDGYPLKRKVGGRTAPWSKGPKSLVRVPMLPTSYLQREAMLAQAAVIEERSSDE